jgi:membrane fusion protein, adhesin transport system
MNDMTPINAPRHVEDYVDRLKPRAASNLLLWGILAFFVLFVLWAAFTKLDRTVTAMGRIIPSAQLQVVSNLEGGVIDAILVHTGDLIAVGAPIVRLNPTLSTAELGSGEATVNALTAKMARLEAEVAGRTPLYPAASDPAMAEQIRIEQAVHMARLADLASAQDASAARLLQARRAVNEAQAMASARASALRGARQQADVIRPLVERGIEPRMALIDADNKVAIAADEAAASRAAIARAMASVAEATAAQAQQRQDWRAKAADELAAAQAERGARSRSLPALADRSARTIVRAPMAGRINRVLVNTVGGTLRPAEPIAEIVPSEQGLMVEVLVSPKDIAFVRIGQQAKVDITAYESAVYGSLHGKVLSISPDATINERTGESHYTVKIQTDADALIDRSEQRLPIGPGMVANASLIGDKRSVLDYILTPITRLSERALRE